MAEELPTRRVDPKVTAAQLKLRLERKAKEHNQRPPAKGVAPLRRGNSR